MSSEFFRSQDDPLYIPEGGPGGAVSPPNVYEQVGEQGVKQLLLDFYQELHRSEISGMFQGNLEAAAEKSALFFIGLLGGPPLYHQTHGSPRMRMRHLPFRITDSFRHEWLRCFYKVLENPSRYNFPEESVSQFKEFLSSFSAWMVNSSDI